MRRSLSNLDTDENAPLSWRMRSGSTVGRAHVGWSRGPILPPSDLAVINRLVRHMARLARDETSPRAQVPGSVALPARIVGHLCRAPPSAARRRGAVRPGKAGRVR